MATVMQILPPAVAKEFDMPPKLLWRDRRTILNLPDEVKRYIEQIRRPEVQANFAMQYLYFKTSGRFFPAEAYQKNDMKVLARKYKVPEDSFAEYHPRTMTRHRDVICEFTGFTRSDSSVQEVLKMRADELCKKQVRPRHILAALVEYNREQKVEGLTYHTLASIITESFNAFKEKLASDLNANLTPENKTSLDNLIEMPKDGSSVLLKEISHFSHSRQLKSIKENCAKLSVIQAISKDLTPLVTHLHIEPEVIDYYARSALSFQPLQLARRGPDRYLYLFCAVIHLNRFFQDALVELLLLNCRSSENSVTKMTKERAEAELQEQREAMKQFLVQAESTKKTLDKIQRIVNDSRRAPIEIINEIREIYAKRTRVPDDNTPIPATASDHREQCIEEVSGKLKLRISSTITLLELDMEHSDSAIAEAIDYFNNSERISKDAPTEFLKEEQKDSIWKEGKIQANLYRGYLFYAIAHAFKSGTLNLKESYKFRSFESYLISSNRWKNGREQFLSSLKMENLSSPNDVLNILENELSMQNEKTQGVLIRSENQYSSIDANGKISVKTPAKDPVDERSPSDFMPVYSSVPLFQILSAVEGLSEFSAEMDHFYQKSVKKRPHKTALLSAVIGYGCNLGVERMARMVRNIRGEDVNYAAQWMLSVDSVTAANNAVLAVTERLKLSARYYRNPGIRHTSSDGQKYVVGVDSIHASYSHKYFGTQKGISVYSFIDEAHKLTHSTVITPSEREAAYVIDGLMANDVVQSDIHSTDTHGYSEIVFAVSHLLGVSFAPRIKNVKHQRYYSFEMPSEANREGYKILSSGRIKTELIESQWEDILRLIATIKSKEETASQLFKRLSSYSRQHPLYRALKQFGRIVKSIFLLRYIDDVELRQAIEKQLNKIESYHQFAKAIFFGGNQEFNYASREEQLLAESCKRLIANSIICWNYLYLSKRIAAVQTPEEKREIVRAVETGSIITWQHVNFHGEYDLSEKSLKGAERFDLEEIMAIDFESFM